MKKKKASSKLLLWVNFIRQKIINTIISIPWWEPITCISPKELIRSSMKIWFSFPRRSIEISSHGSWSAAANRKIKSLLQVLLLNPVLFLFQNRSALRASSTSLKFQALLVFNLGNLILLLKLDVIVSQYWIRALLKLQLLFDPGVPYVLEFVIGSPRKIWSNLRPPTRFKKINK